MDQKEGKMSNIKGIDSIGQLVVSIGGHLRFVRVCDIIYLEKNLRKIVVKYRCRDKSELISLGRTEDFEFYGKMEDVEPYLSKNFVRCHRSYIINLNHIREIYNNRIILFGGESVFLGRDSVRRVKKAYLRFIEGKS